MKHLLQVAAAALLIATGFDAEASGVAPGRIGGGGAAGGWPDGMENMKIRLIRLEYDGPGWDDGMDAASRAELNFLDAFHQLTGFQVASRPESHRITLLKKYPKGYAPPFVYMTGSGDIRVGSNDVSILRAYLLAGGMLVADCGSPQWDRSFRLFAQELFADRPLMPIADDDVIFQIPFSFPSGAPPLWHHGGRKALGIKREGRWMVFYHPGGMKDAWKTGHSGLTPQRDDGAIQMGVNLVYYSFSRYLALTRKYRADGAETPNIFRDARSSFAKGLLTFYPAGRDPVVMPLRAPWALYGLGTVKGFAADPLRDEAVKQVQTRLRYKQDILDALRELDGIPVEAYEVRLSGGDNETNLALLRDLGERRYLVLLFEGSADSKACPLLDTCLVTVQDEEVNIRTDVIPRKFGSASGDLGRLWSWYNGRLEFTPTDVLTNRLLAARSPRAETAAWSGDRGGGGAAPSGTNAVGTIRAANAPEPATSLRIREVARPEEIPAVPAVNTDTFLRDLIRSEEEKLRGGGGHP